MKVLNSKQITEEMHVHDKWYKDASKQTPETIEAFLRKLANYQHDYGTICHAVAASAIAAAWAMNATPQGGITGFQAGCVMWEIIKNWSYSNNKCGLKMVNYDDMLYPQYEEKFGKIITKSTWKALQEQANKNLEEKNTAAEKVIKHWQSIADGNVPFGYEVKDED